MNLYLNLRTGATSILGIVFLPALIGVGAMLAAGNANAETGVEILTRGPIHEAFAEASMAGATAGFTITRAPYDPIVEVPPDQRPDGADVAWIPGYWSWDEDRDDFIWVSGVWRDLPPNRQWAPGYWATVSGGYQWVSGFWGNTAQTDIDYLPPPPESLEYGPSSPSPRPGNSWSPGCWVWQQSRYDWQPGYWVAPQTDWIWTPAHYTWTPRGHVYVPGYWDYALARRGVIFAPVYYAQPVYRQPSYHYAPATIIDIRVITTCLFVQASSQRYYFGDYYDARYDARGYYPWHESRPSDHRYDPLYAQYRFTQLQNDRNWDQHVDERYHHRRDNVEARPPQTLALQVNIINTRNGDRGNPYIGRSLAEVAQNDSNTYRFRSVNATEREQIESRGRAVRTYQSERARLETRPQNNGKNDKAHPEGRSIRVKLPESPVASRPGTRSDGAMKPPPAPKGPRAVATENRKPAVNPKDNGKGPESPGVQRKPRPTGPMEKTPNPGRGERSDPRVVEPRRPTKTESAPSTPSSTSPRDQGRGKPEKMDERTPQPGNRDSNVQKPTQKSQAVESRDTNRQGRRTNADKTEGSKKTKKK